MIEFVNVNVYFLLKINRQLGLFLFNDWVDLCLYRIFILVRDRDIREGKRFVSVMFVNYLVRLYFVMIGYDDDIYDEDQWVSNMFGIIYIYVF